MIYYPNKNLQELQTIKLALTHNQKKKTDILKKINLIKIISLQEKLSCNRNSMVNQIINSLYLTFTIKHFKNHLK